MMELPKLTQNKLEKYSNLKFNHNFPTREGLLLKSLQNENHFIKKKLEEFESRLDMYPIAISNDKLKSQSINVNKNDQLVEMPKFRKIKSSRPSKRIDAFFSNSQQSINELKEIDEENRIESSREFKIPEKTFSRLNSARLNSAYTNSSRLSSARSISSRICSAPKENEPITFSRLNSATQARSPSRERLMTARNVPSNLSARIGSAKTVDTVSTVDESMRTTDSALDKIDQVIDHLKKHRRSAFRKRTIEENFHRPKTTNTISRQSTDKEVKPESAKKKTRSKSAKKSAKIDDYQHMFYSNSWRIHSEFMADDVDRNPVWDNTTCLFYKTSRKQPETFIFAPDWI